MLSFTAMSSQREIGTKKLEGFASINLVINEFGAMTMKVSCYDAYQSGVSKAISKLPIIRKLKGVTDFQSRLNIAVDSIVNSDELIVGFYKRDLSALSQLIREFKNTSINDGKSILDIDSPIKEVVNDIPKQYNVRSSFDVANYFKVDMTIVQELACIVFDVDYYAELPECAVRAALYCCIKVQSAGYELEDLLISCTKYMTDVERFGACADVVVNIEKRVTGVLAIM